MTSTEDGRQEVWILSIIENNKLLTLSSVKSCKDEKVIWLVSMREHFDYVNKIIDRVFLSFSNDYEKKGFYSYFAIDQKVLSEDLNEIYKLKCN